MIANGTYRARATGGEYGESKNKGTTFVKVGFVITKGGEEEGSQISWDGYFTERTQERTIQALKYCGCTFPGGDITNLTGIDANEVEIVVEHEDYENAQGEPRTRARVAWVNNPGAFGISEEQKLTGAKLSSFAAKMKGQLLAAAKKTSSPNGAAPKSKSPPDDFNYGSADDIPF